MERRERNGYRQSNGNHNKSKGKEEGKCTRCVHDHLWKNCLYNPANPKNILGKLAAKATKPSSSGTNHNHHQEVVTVDDDESTGFVKENKPNSNKKKGKPLTFASNRKPFTDTTNIHSHHIDCMSIDDLQQPESPELMTRHLNTSKVPNSSSHGLCSEKPNRKRLRNSGTRPRRSDVDDCDDEELRCYHKLCTDVTEALYSDSSDLHSLAASELGVKQNDKIVKRLSETDIVPGADTPMTIVTTGTINGEKSKRPLRALVDSGSKKTFIYKSALPVDAVPTQLKNGLTTKLLDRATVIDQAVVLNDIVLPELNATTHVTKPFRVFAHSRTRF